MRVDRSIVDEPTSWRGRLSKRVAARRETSRLLVHALTVTLAEDEPAKASSAHQGGKDGAEVLKPASEVRNALATSCCEPEAQRDSGEDEEHENDESPDKDSHRPSCERAGCAMKRAFGGHFYFSLIVRH